MGGHTEPKHNPGSIRHVLQWKTQATLPWGPSFREQSDQSPAPFIELAKCGIFVTTVPDSHGEHPSWANEQVCLTILCPDQHTHKAAEDLTNSILLHQDLHVTVACSGTSFVAGPATEVPLSFRQHGTVSICTAAQRSRKQCHISNVPEGYRVLADYEGENNYKTCSKQIEQESAFPEWWRSCSRIHPRLFARAPMFSWIAWCLVAFSKEFGMKENFDAALRSEINSPKAYIAAASLITRCRPEHNMPGHSSPSVFSNDGCSDDGLLNDDHWAYEESSCGARSPPCPATETFPDTWSS